MSLAFHAEKMGNPKGEVELRLKKPSSLMMKSNACINFGRDLTPSLPGCGKEETGVREKSSWEIVLAAVVFKCS